MCRKVLDNNSYFSHCESVCDPMLFEKSKAQRKKAVLVIHGVIERAKPAGDVNIPSINECCFLC